MKNFTKNILAAISGLALTLFPQLGLLKKKSAIAASGSASSGAAAGGRSCW